MLLNEDYFNEIEITDDDITDKDTNHNNDLYGILGCYCI